MKRALVVGLFLLSNAFAAGVDFSPCSTVTPATDPVDRISMTILEPGEYTSPISGITYESRNVKVGVGRHVVFSQDAIGTANDEGIMLFFMENGASVGSIIGSTAAQPPEDVRPGLVPVRVKIPGINAGEAFDMNCQHIQ